MQYLKDSVRSKIMESAKAEFLKRGYKHGNLRRIAEEADITPGNIYRYFTNKEDLLRQILEPLYQEIRAVIEAEEVMERTPYGVERTMIRIRSLVENFPMEVGIAIREEAGGAFQERLVETAANRLIRDMNCDPGLSRLLAATFTDALLLIFREYQGDPDKALRYIQKLFYFYFRDGSEVDLYN